MKIKAFNLAEADRSSCSQLAKARFFQYSDRGTKFFHGLIKTSRSRNHITSISLTDGNRSKSENQVSDAFLHFYKDLLGSDISFARLDQNVILQGNLLKTEHANDLTRPVSHEEIKSALFRHWRG